MIEATLKANLLQIVAAYRKKTGSSISAVSRRFYGNADFLQEFIDDEHSISIKKLDQLVGKFRSEWPPGADWPFLRSVIIERFEPKKSGTSSQEPVAKPASNRVRPSHVPAQSKPKRRRGRRPRADGASARQRHKRLARGS